MEEKLKVYRVNRINTLSSLISFSLHPVPIQISEETIDVVRASSITVPFSGIVPQQFLVLKRIRLLKEKRSIQATRHDEDVNADTDISEISKMFYKVPYEIIV